MPVQAIPTTSKQLRILGDEEIDALYGRPRFTPDERLEYFAFTPPELAALEQFRSHPSRLYAMVQLGYLVLLQEWLGICYNGPSNVDPKSPEPGHEQSLSVHMVPLSS